MKAAQLTEYGGLDAVQVKNNVARPQPGDGEVLVEVHAAGLNPWDWKLRDGQAKDYITLNFPATIGGDLAGVVSEVGVGVTGFEAGDAVYGSASSVRGQGAFAEFAPVSIKQLAAKPAGLNFEAAASLPLVGSAAVQALIENLGLKPNQKILIHGGAGGIGSTAIQLAKHLGAYVATTASTVDQQFVRQLGADEAIDYQNQDFSELIKDYDAVFDTVGSETNLKSYQVLKAGGILVSMVAKPDEALTKEHNIKAIHLSTTASMERLTKIAELVKAGALKVNIDKVFPLDEAPEALEYLKTGHPKGKVILQVKT